MGPGGERLHVELGSDGYRVVQEATGGPTGQTIEIVEIGEPASVKQGAGLKGSLHLFRATPQPVLRASTKEG